MEPRLGIYIHIPFCASKCGYCDFYSCAGAADRMADYQHALLEHIEESAGRIAPAYIDTVYFGGGTPSFYGAARLIELLDAVKATGRLLKRAEVTVEVNPDSVRLHDLRALRKAGFNRSEHRHAVGKQRHPENDRPPPQLPRRWRWPCRMPARPGFDNISLDLIYGLPSQTRSDWADTLAKRDRPAPGAHLRLRAQA
ncbi:MAG: radical SAM protein [Oscillospiraceae bacterium]